MSDLLATMIRIIEGYEGHIEGDDAREILKALDESYYRNLAEGC